MRLAIILGLVVLLAACAPQETQPAPQAPGDVVAPTASAEEPYPYEFVGIVEWFNIEAVTNSTYLTREELAGKVVLVDFWTYSCINCIRTLPYLTAWHEKYHDDGLVIVGIHSPEFAFEKKPGNVMQAMAKHGIRYPVGLDNDFATWKEYQNSYWPHKFIFDRNGELVYDHIGEGAYEETEALIQRLLAVEADMVEEQPVPRYASINTPELYLGGVSNRGNVAYDLSLGEHEFSLLEQPVRNTVELGGTWIVAEEYVEAVSDSTLRLFYHAKDIHTVAAGEGAIGVSVDYEGFEPRTVEVMGDDLYTLASTDYKDQRIILEVEPGVRLYTFTFG